MPYSILTLIEIGKNHVFCHTAKADTNITVPSENTKEKYYTLEEQEGLSVESQPSAIR